MTRTAFALAAVIGVVASLAPARAAEIGAQTAPQRIVVAGGDLAEIAFALGAGDRVIGVDATATHPPEAAEREQIGYVRNLSPEGVLSLRPDLLLAAHDAGPLATMERLAAAGVKVAVAPEAPRAEDIAEKIRFVGQAIGADREAEALANGFLADLATVKTKIGSLEGPRPRVLFVLSVRGGAPLVGGAGTSADEMIRLAGADNAGAAVDGYVPMGREGILAAAPDVILMMESHAGRVGGIDTVIDRPEIALTPAGQARRGVTMDGMLLLGFGPRTPAAVAQLARALYPEAAEKAGL